MNNRKRYVLIALLVLAISFTMSGSALAWNNVKYDKVESEIYNGCYYDMGERWGLKYLDHITINIDANGGVNYAYSKLVATKYCTYGYLPEEIVGIELGEGSLTGYSYEKEDGGAAVLGVVRDGYCLKGWSLTKTITSDSELLSVDDWVPTDKGDTITIYAQWAKCDDAYHDWSGKLGSKYTGNVLASSTQDGKDNTSEETIATTDENATSEITKAKQKQAKISKVSNVKGRKIKVKIKKASGYKYQIKISTSKKFKKSVKTYKISKTTYTANKKFIKGKTYYVKVRTYKKISGKTYYGKWSKAKKVKIKK